jgi:hypothetical protein
MQNHLAEASRGAFTLVESVEIMSEVRANKEVGKLTNSGRQFTFLADKIEGGLQGLVIGTLRDRPLEPNSIYQTRDISWKLIDLATGDVASGSEFTKPYSLADDVYAGRSQEFFRSEGNGKSLRPVGFGWSYPGNQKVALKPSDSLELFGLYRGDENPDPHPIFNPNCPLQVQLKVDGAERPLMLLAQKNLIEMKPGWAYAHSQDHTTYAKGHSLATSRAYLPIEPGEEMNIQLKNTSSQPVMIAVFVDGMNILGKVRQLPDENCRAWAFAPGQTGYFRGWYTGERGQEQVEPFVVTRFEDSVAGKLGEKVHVGAITLVMFTNTWPERTSLITNPRPYFLEAYWNPQQKRLAILEGITPPMPPTVGAAPADAFGMGGKKPVASKLEYRNAGQPCTILAAMTIHYAPQDGVWEAEESRQRFPAERKDCQWVSAPTNWPR